MNLTVSRTHSVVVPSLTPVEAAILSTVLYADVFDYPLKKEEIWERLSISPDRGDFQRVLEGLIGRYLLQQQGYYYWIGRDELVPLRRQREVFTLSRWKWVLRYGRWLSLIPFIRMVAASGSQAAGNATKDSDIDLFCIIQENRLWLSRLFIVPISKISQRFRFRMCPNYLLATDALPLRDRNLYTAHEVSQVMPLYGREYYHQFLAENEWTKNFLPHSDKSGRRRFLREDGASVVKRGLEWVLRGRLGDWLNLAAYRAFVFFYRTRAEKRRWNWEALAPAYQVDRYTVPEGGYASAVRNCFHQRIRARIGDDFAGQCMDTLFCDRRAASEPIFYNWDGLFALEYGPSRGDGDR